MRQRLLVFTVVLELFSGSGRWTRAAAAAGEWVLSIDRRFGDSHDLSRRRLQQMVLGWIQAGRVRYLLAGFPCQPFSRARNIPGGPPALRNSEYVSGLPGLREADHRKVTLGNNCFFFVARVLYAWAWSMKAAVQLLRNPRARLTRSDFCCWGTPWRKATGFLTANCQTHLFAKQCTGRGRCSTSHRAHVVLKGTNAQGIFLTSIAERYPQRFCQALVTTCRNACLELQSERLDKFCCKTCGG